MFKPPPARSRKSVRETSRTHSATRACDMHRLRARQAHQSGERNEKSQNDYPLRLSQQLASHEGTVWFATLGDEQGARTHTCTDACQGMSALRAESPRDDRQPAWAGDVCTGRDLRRQRRGSRERTRRQLQGASTRTRSEPHCANSPKVAHRNLVRRRA